MQVEKMYRKQHYKVTDGSQHNKVNFYYITIMSMSYKLVRPLELATGAIKEIYDSNFTGNA